MAINLLDPIGNWNPQLFRELKGRLQFRNLLLTAGVSVIGQLLIVSMYWSALVREDYRYCLVTNDAGKSFPCDYTTPGNIATSMNWQLWWQDVFFFISLAGMFILPMVGVYLLVSDMDREERRGTLNFIRLCPQSASQILVGKILGVPILLYLVALLAFPLHFWSGLSANMSIGEILSFDAVLIAGCVFFYSAALLWSLTANWLGGFQPWLAGGLVGLLFLFGLSAGSYEPFKVLSILLNLFCPAIVLPHLQHAVTNATTLPYGIQDVLEWQLFYVPIGKSLIANLGFMLLNYALWSYWCWQGLNRCFHSSSTTVFSKLQSYWLVGCFNVLLLGLAFQTYDMPNQPASQVDWVLTNFQQILALNLLLFLGLILALSPQRQTMIDWARYRREDLHNRHVSLGRDLMWGEKSPAIVAITLNTLIATIIIAPWILSSWPENTPKVAALATLLLNTLVILVYAIVAQLFLMLRSPKRSMWAVIGLGVVLFLPLFIVGVLGLPPDTGATLWLLTGFHWMSVQHTTQGAFLFSMLTQVSAIILLNLRLTKLVNRLGESATKALLNDRDRKVLTGSF